MEAVDALLRYPLFAGLGRAALEAWAGAGRRLAVQPGQTLLEAGTPGRYAYVLLAGKARVTRAAAGEGERSLEVLTPGQVFGEYALLPPHQSTATCRGSEP